jgi:cell division protein FtsA
MYETIVAAVDLGSSRITAMLGKKDAAGRLSIVAEATVDSGGCISRGLIVNADETAGKVSDLIWSIEKRHRLKIERIYLCMGGQSVRSLEMDADEALAGGMAEDFLPEGYEILDRTVPTIIGRSSLVKSPLDDLKAKLNVVLAGYIVSARALAEAVLTPAEKERGCALIDFGAGKTTLAIYKDNALRYMITIPLGSHLITKDICSLKNIPEREAEDFKIKSGQAVVDDDNSKSPDDKSAPWEVNPIDPNRVIEARMDEILSNVEEQIRRTGYDRTLSAGIVITGGGAALQKLPEAIRNKTGYPVRIATARLSLFASEAAADKRLEHAQIIGLLVWGNEHCVEIVKEEPKPVRDPDIFDGQETAANSSTSSGGGKPKPPRPKPKPPGIWDRIRKGADDISGKLFTEQ